VHITKIKTKGFRNLSRLEIYPNEGLNIFVGKNGQGKTNLLETIYVASKGKSFRAGNFGEWRNQKLEDDEVCSLEFEIEDQNIHHNLKLGWTGNAKQVLLDDKKVTTAKLIQILPIILFSPESLSSIKDGPDKRRSLIDEMLTSSFEQQHYYHQFKKALQNRNKFLRDCKEKQRFEETLYNSLNVLFLNFSTKLSIARINYLMNLEPFVKKALSLIFDDELEYRFDYVISDRKVKDWDAKQILDLHQERASQLKVAEYKSGTSLVGAHKHDIKFYINGNDSRYYSSQGQQRGLILALKMAEVLYRFKKGEKPILLLDDVLSELDEEKRTKLLDFLKSFKTQIFITTTDLLKETELNGHFFKIQKGDLNNKLPKDTF
jgi:DNA replication and repair protein RecF